MIKEEDVILYEFFKKRISTFIKEKITENIDFDDVNSKELKMRISRCWFHLNDEAIRQLITTMKKHGCIKLKKQGIVIKDLDSWIDNNKLVLFFGENGSHKVQKPNQINKSLQEKEK